MVYSHIRDYTIKQYGCKGEDNVSEWSIKDLMEAIYKYYKRYKTNMRPGQEQMDLMKIAHYACMAYWKREEGEEQDTQDEFPLDVGTKESLSQNILEQVIDMGYILEDGREYQIVMRKK